MKTKLFTPCAVLASAIAAWPASTPISNLPEITAPSTNTFLELSDMSATPKGRKVRLDNLLDVGIADSAEITWGKTGLRIDGNVTGPLRLPDGSPSAPAYSFDNDTGAGMFLTISNVLSFSAKGGSGMQLDLYADYPSAGMYTLAPTDSTPFRIGIAGGAQQVSEIFATNVTVATEAYDATGWNGDNTVPTKDAVRDKIEGLALGSSVYINATNYSEPNFTNSTETIFSVSGSNVTVVLDGSITRDTEWDSIGEIEAATGTDIIILGEHTLSNLGAGSTAEEMTFGNARLSAPLKKLLSYSTDVTYDLDFDGNAEQRLDAGGNVTVTLLNTPTATNIWKAVGLTISNTTGGEITVNVVGVGQWSGVALTSIAANREADFMVWWNGYQVRAAADTEGIEFSQVILSESANTIATPQTNRWGFAVENIDGVQVPYSVTEGGRKVYQWAMVDPRKRWFVEDDFLWDVTSSTEANYIWKFTALNSATHAGSDGVADHPGVMRLQTGTVTNGLAQLHLRQTSFIFGDGSLGMDGVLRTGSTDNQTEPWRVRVGWFNQVADAATEPTDGVYLRLDNDSANWNLVTRSNAVETVTSSGVAVSTSYIDFTLRVNEALSQAILTVNGTSVTNTTQIPSVGTLAGLQLHMNKWGGTGVQRELFLDWALVWAVNPGR